MAVNSEDGVPVEGADAFAREPVTADTADLASFEGLDQFQSESDASFQPLQAAPTVRLPTEMAASDAEPVPYVRGQSHHGRALATAALVVLPAVVVTGMLFGTFSGKKSKVGAPTADVSADAPSNAQNSLEPRVSATVPSPRIPAAGVERDVSKTDPRPATSKTASAARRPRSGVSRPAVRQPPMAPATDTQAAHGSQFPSVGVPAPEAQPLPDAAPTPGVVAPGEPADNQRPAVTERDAAAADAGAQVSVTALNSNTGDLTYRWSAPVGTFADPTASQTRFFCPETPQPVAVTVSVTDGKGAAARETITVHCVASKR